MSGGREEREGKGRKYMFLLADGGKRKGREGGYIVIKGREGKGRGEKIKEGRGEGKGRERKGREGKGVT